MPSTNQIKACDASLILAAVHENCEAHKAGIKALQVHIDASADVTGLQLTQIQEHLKRLNGSVADLYKKHDERGAVVDEFHQHKEKYEKFVMPFQWAKKNWWVITLLFLAVVTLIVAIVDSVGAKGMMDAIKDVKDVL